MKHAFPRGTVFLCAAWATVSTATVSTATVSTAADRPGWRAAGRTDEAAAIGPSSGDSRSLPTNDATVTVGRGLRLFRQPPGSVAAGQVPGRPVPVAPAARDGATASANTNPLPGTATHPQPRPQSAPIIRSRETLPVAFEEPADLPEINPFTAPGIPTSAITDALLPPSPDAPLSPPASLEASTELPPRPPAASANSRPRSYEESQPTATAEPPARAEPPLVSPGGPPSAALPPTPSPPPGTSPAGLPASNADSRSTAGDPLPADALALDVLIALADSHHPRLTTAFQKVQSARGRAVQAGLYPNPVVTGSSPQMAGRDSQYNGFISQDIVTAGKLKLDVAAVCREVTQAEFAWQQTRFEILTSIRTQFYTTLAAQARVTALQRLVTVVRRSLEVSERLLMAGEGTKGDALLFSIEVARSEVALANAETILTMAKRQLALLIGMPELDISAVDGALDAALPDYHLDTLRYEVGARNAQANIARVEVDRLGIRLERERVQPVPNINVMGGYQRQVGGPFQNQGLFQVAVEVPLFNRNQGTIFATQSALQGARADVQRIELELATQAARTIADYRAAQQLVAKYEQEIVPKARETFRLSEQLYAQGQIDFLRLLQAQRTLVEAEIARIEAQLQRWTAAAHLAGLLQEEQFP